ncbi:MAG TPA: NFACT family protein [Pyrinomonadaceae bacterium]|nr:NFACT family protein [Pyrinomonadaceae bacterium]
MDEATLNEIVNELQELLPGRFLGRVFQLSAFSLAIDFGLREKGCLFISIEPATPRLYLVQRTTRELEKTAVALSSFVQGIRSHLGSGALLSLAKDENERVVRFFFSVSDELGDSQNQILVAQLTGRSANLFLLGSEGTIKQAWRNPQGEGQQVGELYAPPKSQTKPIATRPKAQAETLITRQTAASYSAAADEYYRQLANAHEFDSLAGSHLARLRKEISRRKKLQTNLRKDLAAHGNPDEHKRAGDLLLANVATASRAGNKVSLTDYYAEGAPSVELEVDENLTLPEAAGAYFSRYTKAKRAVSEIAARLDQLDVELTAMGEKLLRLEAAIASRDLAALGEFEEQKAGSRLPIKKQKASPTLPGMRRYLSSDGYEVLVGRSARDNDQITFHVAKPNDLWLHAGDYPGSHVIVRNSSREDIPHRTIIEAAQLAAKFSQASNDSKVSIHYTRRKFLTKPKGSAPGLVRLSRFKTITVEPGENLERVK